MLDWEARKKGKQSAGGVTGGEDIDVTTVTRRALRVYSALSELRRSNEDVLDALIPFFEPILEVMNGKTFDPTTFALAVRKTLRWRFNADIALHFSFPARPQRLSQKT